MPKTWKLFQFSNKRSSCKRLERQYHNSRGYYLLPDEVMIFRTRTTPDHMVTNVPISIVRAMAHDCGDVAPRLIGTTDDPREENDE